MEALAISATSKTLRDILRARTAGAHSALDRSLGSLDLGDHAGYTAFLTFHYAARAGIERWLAQAAPADLCPPPQTPLIARDLAALGEEQPATPGNDFAAPGGAAWRGVAYVIAGSHLGNRMLLGQVSARVATDARSFLSGADMQDYWRRLRTLLATPADPAECEGAVAGASAAFAHFAGYLGDCDPARQVSAA